MACPTWRPASVRVSGEFVGELLTPGRRLAIQQPRELRDLASEPRARRTAGAREEARHERSSVSPCRDIFSVGLCLTVYVTISAHTRMRS